VTLHGSPRKLQPQEFYAVAEAIAIKKSWEGWSATPYRCQANVITIGWGTTRWWDGGEIPSDARITEAEGEKLIARDLQECVSDLMDAIDVPLTENQLAALISWQYNTGAIKAKDCDLRDAINQGAGDAAIVAEFRRWNKAGGKVSEGLINRRESEVALWEGRDWRQYRG
jgi:lysozyme